MKRAIKMHKEDNVCVLLIDAHPGDSILVDGTEIVSVSDINMPHKAAIVDIPKGFAVIKFGEKIGYATEDIKKGELVHNHNFDAEIIMR